MIHVNQFGQCFLSSKLSFAMSLFDWPITPQKKVLKLWKLLCNSIYSKYKNIKVPISGHLHRFPRGQCLGKTNEMKSGTTIGKKNWEHIGNFGGETHWELGGNTLRKTKIPKYPPKKSLFCSCCWCVES